MREHFGGSSFALAKLGFDIESTVYAGFLALAANLLVAVVATLILRAIKVDEGIDGRRRRTTPPSGRTRPSATCPIRWRRSRRGQVPAAGSASRCSFSASSAGQSTSLLGSGSGPGRLAA